ncbi:vancomycin resistance protein VanJ [Psychromicrobium silvestre]|uniref:Vancomycin resistance protein VanJ n=1 Tax=Psychromicrobium silvestre TaxID=1645614 RepID=A0A7Y9LU65_9MICC|nr:endonuclease/exonuclease/phosphatase family protein [Psychromicrobium silvestre]NYE95657.1 vancomycin resistance protein VanJ [Psychromicrobium silvestre]
MDTTVLPRLDPDDLRRRPAAYRPPRRRRIRPLSTVVVIILSLGLALVLAGHRWLPDVGEWTLALESFLPWLGLLSLLLLIPATRSRSFLAWTAWLVPVVVWCFVFVPAILPGGATATGQGSLTVATQNLQGYNGSLSASSALIAQDADIVALQEMKSAEALNELAAKYPYQQQAGTVALLSKFPFKDSESLALNGFASLRSLHATVQTPSGEVSVYVVHGASVSGGDHTARDAMLSDLQGRVSQDTSSRLLVLGDFNAAPSDRVMDGFNQQLQEKLASNGGFGFSWPSKFPATRPDHILSKGLNIKESSVLAPIGSDHLGLAGSFTF